MNDKTHQESQIVISGVGGQGVLFVTRLLAEAAIMKNLPVFTSETHGMAQRGGTVISHLKVGRFSSPLIRPGHAQGLISLKAEGLEQHGDYVKPGGWMAVNSSNPPKSTSNTVLCGIDADRLAQDLNDPKSLNLVMLGFTLSQFFGSQIEQNPLYCSGDDIISILEDRLAKNENLLKKATKAIKAGLSATP